MTQILLAGALDHPMRFQLTGCEKAGRQAARLLDCLSERADVDIDTRGLCDRMRDKLEARQGVGHQGVDHV